jgi:hypothetical protein
MFSFNFFKCFFNPRIFPKYVGTYCVSIGLLPAKILCAPDFCKLHKQEVPRNVGEMSLQIIIKEFVKKVIVFAVPQSSHLGLFYLLVKIYIRLLTTMLLEITTVN